MKDRFVSLYKTCFPEDGKTLDLFFPSYIGKHNRYFIESDGQICSALYLVQKKLRYQMHTVPLPYIIGLATDPAYRYKGYAKQLIQEVFHAQKDIPFIALYPFKHEFYEKLGFSTPSFDCSFPSDGCAEPSAYRASLTHGCVKTANGQTIEPSADKPNQHFLSVNETKQRYDLFHKGLDFSIERTESDFAFFAALFRRNGQGFYPYNGGYCSPDEFIPEQYRRGDNPGTMVRIVNLAAALSLTDASFDQPLRVVDPLIAENNLSFSLKNGKLRICTPLPDDRTTDIGELTLAVFGQSRSLSDLFAPLRGHLADKY